MPGGRSATRAGAPRSRGRTGRRAGQLTRAQIRAELRELERRAHHEAAHVVMAWERGLPVTRAQIAEGDGREPCTMYVDCAPLPEIDILLAGMAADTIFAGRPRWRRASARCPRSDASLASAVLRQRLREQANGPTVTVALAVERALVVAQIQRLWRTVKAVAAALLATGRLDGEALARLASRLGYAGLLKPRLARAARSRDRRPRPAPPDRPQRFR